MTKATEKIVLEPGETMAERRRRDRRRQDQMEVHGCIRKNPGIGSKDEIAAATGLPKPRVDDAIKAINGREATGLQRVEYGPVRRDGEELIGWHAMDRRAHHHLLDYADERAWRIEHGVRFGRLVRKVQAENGLTTKAAAAAVASITERLDIDLDELDAADLEAIEDLLLNGA